MDEYKKQIIDAVIERNIEAMANSFIRDYQVNGAKFKNIENKHNNIFISYLGKEVAVYSALMRSLDSSLGNTLEKMALEIAKEMGYSVKKGVEGELSDEAISFIAKLLEKYKNTSDTHKPTQSDYEKLKSIVWSTKGKNKFHNSDYLLEKVDENGITEFALVELKIGGDLDNKKARSEKEAIFEQYAILVSRYKNEIENGDVVVKTYFATAYNKNHKDSGGENWSQASVRSFFADEELLIGKDFWNLVCDDDEGWETIKELYKKHSIYLKEAINQIVDSLK